MWYFTGIFAWFLRYHNPSALVPRHANFIRIQQRSFARRSIFEIAAAKKGFGFFSKKEEEKDPGEVIGTDLRVLKYPDPKVTFFFQ